MRTLLIIIVLLLLGAAVVYLSTGEPPIQVRS
jgi:hypothetical protein